MKASSRAHGRVRQEVFLAIIERMSKSMLAMLIWSVIGSVALVLVLGKSLYVVHLVVFVPIGLLAFKHSAIWFDVLMVKTTFSHFTGSSNKMSVVDDNMLLGSLPLEPGDTTHLIKKLGVTAVLTVAESHEVDSFTMSGRPVQSRDWKYLEVTQMQLPVSVHTRKIAPSVLHRGADYINAQLSEGKRIHVHCHNGTGRSALVVLAYLVKYKLMKPTEAYQYLYKKRKIYFVGDSKSKEMEALGAFEASFRN